jgi:hypothetical protein
MANAQLKKLSRCLIRSMNSQTFCTREFQKVRAAAKKQELMRRLDNGRA